jgi:ketosteroid isomerase-like protein
MSEENVEIVRRGTDAYNRGDLDGILENWAPDVVLDHLRRRSWRGCLCCWLLKQLHSG